MSTVWGDPQDTVAEVPRPDPGEAVRRFEQACTDAEHAKADKADAEALPWYQWRRRRAAQEKADSAHAHAVQDAEFARQDLGPNGVGTRPGAWGVLSGAHSFHLEGTLRSLGQQRDLDPGVWSEAKELLEALPQVRLHAHRGDRHGEAEVVHTVLALVDQVREPALRRQLIEHLPVSARPQARSLHELDRHGPLMTLSVTDDLQEIRSLPPEWGEHMACITLHRIVVPGGVAGLGLGTAALQELCRYADQMGLEIVGTMWPGPGYDDHETRIPRLAAWYERHGFRVDALPPEPWQGEARIVREPHST